MNRTCILRVGGGLLLAALAPAGAGDIAAELDTTDGTTGFVVYDANTAALFRVKSDGAVQASGSVSAVSFSGGGAGLTGISGGSLVAGTVSNVHLATGAVGSAQIADGALQSNHFSAGSVKSTAIAIGAVGSAQIANGSITALDLAKAYQSGVQSLDTLIRSNSYDFAAFTTNLSVAFLAAFDAAPIVTLAIESGADYDWSPYLYLREATTSNFTARISVQPISEQVVTNGEYASQYCSMAIVNGNPAMAYRGGDISELDLFYVRASNANGTAWGEPIRLYTNGYASYCSLAMVDGSPAIGFYNSSSDDLLYIRASDTNGAAWGTAAEVLTNGNIGQHVSLAVINGNPAMSSYYSTSNDLVYVRATDSQGTAWGAPVTVATSMHTYGTSLLTVNGNPAISFASFDSDLMFVRGNDVSGATWQTPVLVDTNGGWYSSMAIVRTNPAIAYHFVTAGALLYARATDVNGTAWGTPVWVDTNGTAGVYPSLAVISSNPAVAYWAAGADVLKFVRAANNTGSSWSADPVTVFSEEGVDGVAGLLEIGGSVAIGFASDTYLQFIRSGSVPPRTRLNWVAVEP